MSEYDDRRVEARAVLVGRGSGATPEKIAELQQRVADIEKADRAKPSVPFAKVLARGRTEPADEELSDKEKRRRALPKQGPRPALVHPAQRDAFGRDEDADETVVLKG